MSGPLPAVWGTPGTFKNLKSLALQNNSLSGASRRGRARVSLLVGSTLPVEQPKTSCCMPCKCQQRFCPIRPDALPGTASCLCRHAARQLGAGWRFPKAAEPVRPKACCSMGAQRAGNSLGCPLACLSARLPACQPHISRDRATLPPLNALVCLPPTLQHSRQQHPYWCAEQARAGQDGLPGRRVCMCSRRALKGCWADLLTHVTALGPCAGAIPASWGAAGSFPSLQVL